MIIHTYEKTQRGRACEEYIRSYGAALGEVYILPIPSTRDGVFLKDSKIPIEDIIEASEPGVTIICYGLAQSIKERIIERGARVYDAGVDEDFLGGNAELTALAALGILLGSEVRAPMDISFGIVGYGRIGKRLTRMLLFLGARVRVYTSNPKTRLELCECGLEASESEPGTSLGDIDILVNTAPAVIFDTGREEFKTLRVIDLASGDNFPGLACVESYPSVPAKMFPESAGGLLGECAVKYFDGLK